MSLLYVFVCPLLELMVLLVRGDRAKSSSSSNTSPATTSATTTRVGQTAHSISKLPTPERRHRPGAIETYNASRCGDATYLAASSTNTNGPPHDIDFLHPTQRSRHDQAAARKPFSRGCARSNRTFTLRLWNVVLRARPGRWWQQAHASGAAAARSSHRSSLAGAAHIRCVCIGSSFPVPRARTSQAPLARTV